MSGPKPGPSAPRAAHLNVVEFPGETLNDLPRVLRAIAEQIEQGHFGAVESLALVTEDAEGYIRTFGGGKADYHRAFALFHLGLAQLVDQRADRLVDPVEGG